MQMRITTLVLVVMAAGTLLGSCGGGDGAGVNGGNGGGQGTLTFINNTHLDGPGVTFNCFFWTADSACVGGQGTCFDDVCTGNPQAAGLLPLAPGQTVTTPPFQYGTYSNMTLAENTDGSGWSLSEDFVEIDTPNFVVDIRSANLDP